MENHNRYTETEAGWSDAASIVPAFLSRQPVSPELQAKMDHMESRRGRNHGLEQFRTWIETVLQLPVLKHADSAGQSSAQYSPVMVQIAGTNGKGSVVRWLSMLLESQGLHVGSFTSPHLLAHFERIAIDGRPIPAYEWEKLYDQYAAFFEKEQLTMFEMDLFMALAYFWKVQPQVILMETGMGGTYDAVTALDYDLSLITSIGMDHMAYLGDTLEEIAEAKAGIIKSGVPVITAETSTVPLQIIQKTATEKCAPLKGIRIGSTASRAEDRQDTFTAVCCSMDPSFPTEPDTSIKTVSMAGPESGRTLQILAWNPELPDYQKENFALAMQALTTLGYTADRTVQKKIQKRFMWPGRFMVLRKQPLTVLDGAHNVPGIRALCASIEKDQFDQAYFSVLADKQADEMLELLAEKVKAIILVDFETQRKADLHRLHEKYGYPIVTLAGMAEQLTHTSRSTLICGSLYFAAEVLKYIYPGA